MAAADSIRQQQLDAYNAAFSPMMTKLQESGAGWARIYIDWASIQSSDPLQYNWANYDNWLSQVAAT
ncbi:MAG TPA: hypothetical protein PKD55_24695, partial [Bellilinea sp.]|nr:hypothetical protein [Bellilinea sp.]